jgi:hypothetical protein
MDESLYETLNFKWMSSQFILDHHTFFVLMILNENKTKKKEKKKKKTSK